MSDGVIVRQIAAPLWKPGEIWGKLDGMWCRFATQADHDAAFAKLGEPVGILEWPPRIRP